MGVPLDEMVVWDPNEIWGGLDARAGQEREAAFCGRATAPSTRASPSQQIDSVPEAVSRRPGHRRTRSARSTSSRPPTTAARPKTSSSTVKESPAGSVWAVAHRDPSRQPSRATKSRRTAPSSRSIRSAACARRCSASRRTTCSGFSKGWSKARSTTRSSSPTSRSRDQGWRSTACCRYSQLKFEDCDAACNQLQHDMEDVDGAHSSAAAVRLRRARAAHRRADDARFTTTSITQAYVTNLNAALEKHPNCSRRASRI